MIRAIAVVGLEAFVLLVRDKIFVPALVAILAVSAFANLASDWSIEDFTKVLFDIGFFGFQVTGGLVAIFWGIKAVTDSRQNGALEVHLAAPVSRVAWVLGKFLGLSVSLVLVGLLLTGVWQGLMLLNGFDYMTPAQLVAFGFLFLGWLVLGATGMMFATFLGQAVATFAAFGLWLTGLISGLVARTLTPETPAITRELVQGIARIWDLQQFNLVDHAIGASAAWSPNMNWRVAYGVVLIVLMVSTACVVFRQKDVSS